MTPTLPARRSRSGRLGGLLPAALLAALMAACSSADKRKSAPPPPPALIRNADRSVITVSDAEGNARIVLERGQQLVVRLPTGVTGGLEWSLVDMRPGVLAAPDVRFERAPRDLAGDALPRARGDRRGGRHRDRPRAQRAYG